MYLSKIDKNLQDTNFVFLQTAELIITKKPLLITTILGSCVTLTMYDRISKLSAMCHCLMPTAPYTSLEEFQSGEFKYVDTTMQYMIDMFRNYKINLMHTELKLFGGSSNIIKGEINKSSIGRLNVESASKIIHQNELKIAKAHTGGKEGRKIIFNTQTGVVYLKTFKGLGKD